MIGAAPEIGSPELPSESEFRSLLDRHCGKGDLERMLCFAAWNPTLARRIAKSLAGKSAHDLRKREADLEEKASYDRQSRRRAPALFLTICRSEGIDPSVIAHAILPEAIPLLPGDGHPWSVTGSAEHLKALANGRRPYIIDDHGVMVRSSCDPRGRLQFDQTRATIGIYATLGEAHLSTWFG